MSVDLKRRRFTVDDYHAMARAGVFTEDDRVELIEGEIFEMAAIGSRHAACVDRLTRIFSRVVEDRAIVRVQGPVRLSDLSEPEPDIALLAPRDDFYAERHPEPGGRPETGYKESRRFREGETLRPRALDGVEIPVSGVLPG